MKKLVFVVFALFALSVRADNTITSKEYVDGQVSNLQTQFPAKNTNTVVTNTGTAGTIGEKAIYDTTGTYAEQQDALVTAGAFNTAVQNALESEFVCVEWLGDVHDNAHCLLYEVKNAYHKSKNLFNKNDPRIRHRQWQDVDNCFSGQQVSSAPNSNKYFISEPIAIEPNTTYTITKTDSGSNPSFFYLDENLFCLGGFKNLGRGSLTFTVPNNPDIKYLLFPGAEADIDTIQLEQGETATPYQPYGENTWLPEN